MALNFPLVASKMMKIKVNLLGWAGSNLTWSTLKDKKPRVAKSIFLFIAMVTANITKFVTSQRPYLKVFDIACKVVGPYR